MDNMKWILIFMLGISPLMIIGQVVDNKTTDNYDKCINAAKTVPEAQRAQVINKCSESFKNK